MHSCNISTVIYDMVHYFPICPVILQTMAASVSCLSLEVTPCRPIWWTCFNTCLVFRFKL